MSHKNLQFLAIILIGLFSQFASDIYAPSLPAIAQDLRTSIDNAQWTMSIYMFGVAVMQVFYGALSEVFGRKVPMIFGLIIMFIGSIICMYATNINILLAGRLVQGMGVSACACLWRSVFRDSFSGDELAQYASYATIVVMFVIPGAPLLGGFFQDYFGWQITFMFIATYSVFAIAILIFGMQETSKNHKKLNINIKVIAKNYLILLRSPVFMGTISSVFLSFGALFSWFIIGPVLLIDRIGITPSKFGIVSCICGIIGFGIGGLTNAKFVKIYCIPNMLRFGWTLMLLGGVLLFLGHFIFALEFWSFVIPTAIFFYGSSFIWPNAFATAFAPFGHIAGYAGALYGTTQVGGGAVLASVFSYLPDDNQFIFSVVITFAAIFSWLLYEFIVFPNIEKL